MNIAKETIFEHESHIRTRYGEVDQMGYLYHAHYVTYCHESRTELLRSLGIEDHYMESKSIMMPVVHFEIDYKQPVFYDETIRIRTCIEKMPRTRFHFKHEFFSESGELTSVAKSTVVFVDAQTRKPLRVPSVVLKAIAEQTKKEERKERLHFV